MADGLPDGLEKLIDPAPVEAVLDVKCEDPTHVRGKVAGRDRLRR